METEEAAEAFFKCWRKIYNTSENKIDEIWGEEVMQRLIRRFEEEDKENSNWIREHMDMAMRVEGAVSSMKLPRMEEGNLEVLIQDLKNNKAAGPDKLRGEIFKELGKSKICKEIMIECYNKVPLEKEAPRKLVEVHN